MDFTFGIITSGNNDDFILRIIDDIKKQNIPNYEIIIVGGLNNFNNEVKHILFDESIKLNWITKKKNIITNVAKYDNVVYMHDYITLNDDWYTGFLEFGDNFKVCMTKMINFDGTRFRDWTLWFGDKGMEEVNNLFEHVNVSKVLENIGCKWGEFLLPYSVTNLSKFMYFSGAYWVAKKEIMIEIPLNEELTWCNSEDVVWSLNIRKKYEFSINDKSSITLLKYKGRILDDADEKTINELIKIKALYDNSGIKW